MMTGQDVTITVNPQARIQDLLETTNRYLERARTAESAFRTCQLELSNAQWDQLIDKHVFETLRDMAGANADRNEFAQIVLSIVEDRLTDMTAIPTIPADHPVFR